MDEFVIDGNYAFGRVGNTYVALIGNSELYFGMDIVDNTIQTTDDLRQDGQNMFWITEASTEEAEGSFADFMTRIKANEVTFDEETLELFYEGADSHHLEFKGDYKLNDTVMDLEYDRFEAPYATVERESDTITISYNGKTLFLDFYNMERREEE